MSMLFEYVWLPVWFALPGLVANTCPGFARTLPGGTVPVAPNILGPNKTIMALPTAIAGATVVALMQHQFGWQSENYLGVSWLTAALCFGLGAPLGDWTKSLLKRRRKKGFEPGSRWWLEKFDFLLMSFLLLATLGIYLPVQYYVTPLLLMAVAHGPGNKLSYKLGLRNSPH